MFIICAYDIPDDKRRTRLFKTLGGYGTPRQKSVFECDLSAAHYARMRKDVKGLIKPAEDNVRFYELCGACLRRVRIVGGEALAIVPDVFVIGKNETSRKTGGGSHRDEKRVGKVAGKSQMIEKM